MSRYKSRMLLGTITFRNQIRISRNRKSIADTVNSVLMMKGRTISPSINGRIFMVCPPQVITIRPVYDGEEEH